MFDLVANGQRRLGEVPVWRAILEMELKSGTLPFLAGTAISGIWLKFATPPAVAILG
jgi:hypothetical protein